MSAPRVAIVDHGLGNLYSVERACRHEGIDAAVTADRAELARAAGIILPGVGAFGDAMSTLRRLGLDGALRDAAAAGTPILGICLGIQLLMTESQEFGRHEGLGLIPGRVLRLPEGSDGGRALKVPAVGWNGIRRPSGAEWAGTPLEGLADGEAMYFVHSFFVQPEDASVILSTTRHGGLDYCSSLRRGRVFACQFHPERSGPEGLRIYRGWARELRAGSDGGREG